MQNCFPGPSRSYYPKSWFQRLSVGGQIGNQVFWRGRSWTCARPGEPVINLDHLTFPLGPPTRLHRCSWRSNPNCSGRPAQSCREPSRQSLSTCGLVDSQRRFFVGTPGCTPARSLRLARSIVISRPREQRTETFRCLREGAWLPGATLVLALVQEPERGGGRLSTPCCVLWLTQRRRAFRSVDGSSPSIDVHSPSGADSGVSGSLRFR